MRKPVLKIIELYQKILTPVSRAVFGPYLGCRFHPTCSHYTYQAVEKFGVIKGLSRGIGRILRCNPLSQGGFDPLT